MIPSPSTLLPAAVVIAAFLLCTLMNFHIRKAWRDGFCIRCRSFHSSFLRLMGIAFKFRYRSSSTRTPTPLLLAFCFDSALLSFFCVRELFGSRFARRRAPPSAHSYSFSSALGFLTSFVCLAWCVRRVFVATTHSCIRALGAELAEAHTHRFHHQNIKISDGVLVRECKCSDNNYEMPSVNASGRARPEEKKKQSRDERQRNGNGH